MIQACGAAYFDRDIYTGTNGLLVWQMAGLGVQSHYQPGPDIELRIHE
jgi:hypothetical protein